MNAVEFDRVSIVFGERPEAALPLMDQGLTRAEIQTRTGQILGVHDATLTVAEGEILVLMGLSGSGKSTLLRAVNGLNPVVRGEVRVHDGAGMVSVGQARPEALRRLRRTRAAAAPRCKWSTTCRWPTCSGCAGCAPTCGWFR